ncbi:MAG: PLP-dependent aminotransferase family protein [Solirubrobacterales bacterium]
MSPTAVERPISFERGAPSPDLVHVDGLRSAAEAALSGDFAAAVTYGTAAGYQPLREWAAAQHGVAVEQVMVTNGSMQAGSLLFDVLLEPGDDVVVEEPMYDRTLVALRMRGATVHAVPSDSDGIDVDELERRLREGLAPKLVQVIPTFQNPSGFTLSLERRERLVGLAAEFGFPLIEDDPYRLLRFAGEELPTLRSLEPDGRIVLADSFSKTVCPGLRVGYLVGPTDLIDRVVRLATDTYISPSQVAEAIVHEFCASGAIEDSIAAFRVGLKERAELLAAGIVDAIPGARCNLPQGGYFLWVELPEEIEAGGFVARARDAGIRCTPGADFMLPGRPSNSVRLAYSGVTTDEIEEGLERIAAASRSR